MLENHIIKCMLCDNNTTIQLPKDVGLFMIYHLIARQQNWAMSWSKMGGFICCPDCYLKAFDLSKGGQVGFLKPEFEYLCRKE